MQQSTEKSPTPYSIMLEAIMDIHLILASARDTVETAPLQRIINRAVLSLTDLPPASSALLPPSSKSAESSAISPTESAAWPAP